MKVKVKSKVIDTPRLHTGPIYLIAKKEMETFVKLRLPSSPRIPYTYISMYSFSSTLTQVSGSSL